MERKIGEIFEYNGVWCQCVVAIQGCRECSFRTHDYCAHPLECLSETRSDKTSVIFKKLEKVGEPYEFDGHIFQSYHTFEVPIFTENYATVREYGNNSKISIEIKQNKEDMEENKLNLKPFDIQKAREGKPVCTRGGKKARIICFDRKGYNMFPIVALIMNGDRESDIYTYRPNGTWDNSGNESDKDLMMLPEKKEGWVNIVKEALSDDRVVLGRIFDSYEDAFMSGKANERYIATVKIEWTE